MKLKEMEYKSKYERNNIIFKYIKESFNEFELFTYKSLSELEEEIDSIYIRKTLSELVKEEFLIRIKKGVYIKNLTKSKIKDFDTLKKSIESNFGKYNFYIHESIPSVLFENGLSKQMTNNKFDILILNRISEKEHELLESYLNNIIKYDISLYLIKNRRNIESYISEAFRAVDASKMKECFEVLKDKYDFVSDKKEDSNFIAFDLLQILFDHVSRDKYDKSREVFSTDSLMYLKYK